jgi:Uma2 family endonuclease
LHWQQREPIITKMSATAERVAVPSEVRRYTYDELLAEFPESNQPCELWDGELVMSPSPSFFHQEIALCFYRALYAWVKERQLGKVISAPIDMVLSPHRVTQPDVAFIAKDRLQIIQRAIMGPADIVAEVISLGGRNRDRIDKKDLYEQHGVKEYWIIDPEAQTADVLFLEASRYVLLMRSGIGQNAASRVLPGFEVSVRDLFEG